MLRFTNSNQATSFSKWRPRFPSVSKIDFILICEKLTKNQIGPPVLPTGGRGFLHASEIDFILICKKLMKNQIGPPAFPNGGRGQPIFRRFKFATP